MFRFDFTPCWFLFRQKGGEHCFIVYFNPFVDVDKRGEKYFSIYACLFKFISKFILATCVLSFVDIGIKSMDISIKNIFCCFCFVGIKSFYWNFYWYQEQLFKNMFILKFGIKSMFMFIAFMTYLYLFIAMHELRGSFYEA